MAKVIEGLYYAESHEYVRVEGEFGYVGITDYAQGQLGNVVYVDMPEVDDDRYDVLTQGVKLLFDEYIAKLDMLKAQALGEIALHASGHSAERVDTAKKDIDEIYDDCKQHAEQIKTMKLDEIEEAHQHYLEKKQAEMDMQAESNSAAGSVLNYKLGETED